MAQVQDLDVLDTQKATEELDKGDKDDLDGHDADSDHGPKDNDEDQDDLDSDEDLDDKDNNNEHGGTFFLDDFFYLF